MFQTSCLLSNTPYVSTPTYNNTQFSNPAGGTAAAPGLQSLSGLDSTYRPAMVQNWSLTFENEIIRHGILAVTYAGNTGPHLLQRRRSQLRPQRHQHLSTRPAQPHPPRPSRARRVALRSLSQRRKSRRPVPHRSTPTTTGHIPAIPPSTPASPSALQTTTASNPASSIVSLTSSSTRPTPTPRPSATRTRPPAETSPMDSTPTSASRTRATPALTTAAPATTAPRFITAYVYPLPFFRHSKAFLRVSSSPAWETPALSPRKAASPLGQPELVLAGLATRPTR